jgi:hypothetical protein
MLIIKRNSRHIRLDTGDCVVGGTGSKNKRVPARQSRSVKARQRGIVKQNAIRWVFVLVVESRQIATRNINGDNLMVWLVLNRSDCAFGYVQQNIQQDDTTNVWMNQSQRYKLNDERKNEETGQRKSIRRDIRLWRIKKCTFAQPIEAFLVFLIAIIAVLALQKDGHDGQLETLADHDIVERLIGCSSLNTS